MLAKIESRTVLGIEAKKVEVEVDMSGGLPCFTIVGLPDTAVKESRDRVISAIKNCVSLLRFFKMEIATPISEL